MTKSFYTKNRQTLYETIPDRAMFIIFSGLPSHKSADEEFRFFANRNFVYLTGIDEPDCIMMARRVNGAIQETLYIRDPNEEVEKWTGRRIRPNEATDCSGIINVALRSTFDAEFNKFANDTYYDSVYLCIEGNPAQAKTDQNNFFRRNVLKKYPNLGIANAFSQIASQRMIKTPEEIDNIKKAISITHEGILAMMKKCKYATNEMDLFAEFMYVIHKHGAVESAFKPIISCGDNNFYLHYETPTGKLIDGALCLTDVGARVDFCSVDISRVFPRNGKFSEKQRKLYNIALEINDEVTETIKEGMLVKDIDELNRNLTFPRLKAEGILSDVSDLDKYVWHKCSHHIGFDVHDVGTYEVPLEEGMFFSMDMGLYVPEWGIGMRIEDDVLMTSGALTNMSIDIPRTIDNIEMTING